MKTSVLLSLSAALALVGCSATLPVQTGGLMTKNSGKKVTAEVSTTNILGFAPLTLAKTETVLAKLQSDCGGGKVVGVTALVRSTYIVLGTIDKVQASGYCAD